jgi:hypothetical protein
MRDEMIFQVLRLKQHSPTRRPSPQHSISVCSMQLCNLSLTQLHRQRLLTLVAPKHIVRRHRPIKNIQIVSLQ